MLTVGKTFESTDVLLSLLLLLHSKLLLLLEQPFVFLFLHAQKLIKLLEFALEERIILAVLFVKVDEVWILLRRVLEVLFILLVLLKALLVLLEVVRIPSVVMLERLVMLRCGVKRTFLL